MKKWILLTVLLLVVTGVAQAIPDPSAWYCILQGYKLEIRTDEQGNQYGVCVFPDDSECSTWAYYCKCEPNGITCWPGNFTCHWPCKEMRCKEAGEPVLVSKCCEGLDEIYPAHIFDANCNKLQLVGWLFLCSECGNGICEDWESRCNCPEDCAQPSIIYVDDDAAGNNDGSSWSDAFNDLQDALDFAIPGDEIHVAQGIYKPDQGNGITPGDREATFQLKTGVVIKGGYAGFGEPDPYARDIGVHGTILSGYLDGNDIDVNDSWDLWNEPSRAENSYHVVTGSGTDETAVLDGFTITAGNANGSNPYDRGGGMINENGSPTLTNCAFIGNSARWGGGGMHNSNSNPTLTNCTFSGNTASYYGGGIYNEYSSPTITNCVISDNWVHHPMFAGGGGIYCYGSSATIAYCTIRSNTASAGEGGGGGGIYCDSSNLIISNCTISENIAAPSWFGGSGGGIRILFSDAIIINCTINNNWSYQSGGGISIIGGSPRIINSNITGNSSASSGGGMSISTYSHPTITNCIISGNIAGWNAGGIYSYVSSLTISNCTIQGNSCDAGGGAMWHRGGTSTLTNCILWDDTAILGSEIYLAFYSQTQPSAITIRYSDVAGGYTGVYVETRCALNWGEGNIDADPCFVEPGYWVLRDDPNIVVEPNDPNAIWIEGDYHLLPDSSCIDAGDPNHQYDPNETDLDGKPRVIGGRIDMGAFEYRPLIPAEARIIPRTINLASKGNWITCYIWLPEGYDVADIDPNSIFLEDEIQAESFLVNEQEQVAMARFSREDLRAILNAGEVELTISGQLTDGTVFEARDVIRVIDKGGGKK